jgi:glucose-1-phosphate cytidylyltransferase
MPDSEPSQTGGPFGPCKTVILAGGFGTRLAERTDDLPKPMVEIGPQPILWHILKIYSRFGFNDFLIAAGHRSDVIKRFFFEYRLQTSDLVFDFTTGEVNHIRSRIEPWRVAVIDTGDNSMTGGRLRRLRDLVGGATFMMTYGDGVADIDLAALLRFHQAHGKAATFTAVQRPTQFGVPRLEGDRAVAFSEKPASEGDWINAGFFVLDPRALDRIAGDDDSFELHTLPQLAAAGELMAYRHRDFWHPMDTLRDVRLLNALWTSGAAPWKVWN